MEIEKEIKQPKFSSEYQKLIINIFFTSNWLSLKSNQDLKKYGISNEQFNILRILKGQYPKTSSIQLLVDRMINKSSNASRIVEKLKLKGLVTRKECESDRRLVEVLITDKGLKLLVEIDSNGSELDEILKNVSETEAKELNRILDKLRG
jgi:DNA-binding MarR family transcriptional regulator